MEAEILASALRQYGYSTDVAYEYLGQAINSDRPSIREN